MGNKILLVMAINVSDLDPEAQYKFSLSRVRCVCVISLAKGRQSQGRRKV